MIEEYQDESIAAQKTQEELMSKGRKGKWWEKVLPLAGMFMGPMGSAILGGLQGMYTAKQQSKHALGQIGAARGAGVDVGKWGNTFLGSGARETKAASDSMFDSLTRDAQVSDMGLLKSGLTSGISSYAMGKMGEGIKGGIKGVSADKELLAAAKKTGLDTTNMLDTGGLSVDTTYGHMGDLSTVDAEALAKLNMDFGKGMGNANAMDTLKKLSGLQAGGGDSYLSAIFGEKGMGQDMSKLLKEGGTGQNSMASILAMLGLTQQGDQ